MHISEAGIKLIKEFEACLAPVPGKKGFFKPYLCPAGVLTIGWGHTNLAGGPHFDRFTVWSQQQCDDALVLDLRENENDVWSLLKVPVLQSQFDALVSFSFNVGKTNLSKSTLLRKLNARDYKGAAEEFLVWNKARVPGKGLVPLRGLTRRRVAEKTLFSSPDHVDVSHVLAATVGGPMPQSVSPPRHDRPSLWSRILVFLGLKGES